MLNIKSIFQYLFKKNRIVGSDSLENSDSNKCLKNIKIDGNSKDPLPLIPDI